MATNYNEAFENLATMAGFNKKAPHKAILLLSIIELFDRGILTANEVCLNDSLESMFLSLWNKYVESSYYQPKAYIAYWELTKDGFWHLVPNWRKEELYETLRRNRYELSSAAIKECVLYAEFDDDLFFLMTMSYSRDELKRSLLRSAFQMSEQKINAILSETEIDWSVSPDYQGNETSSTNTAIKSTTAEEPSAYDRLSIDVKIELNLAFYNFLKDNQYERDELLSINQDAKAFYQNLTTNSSAFDHCSSSLAYELKTYLRDLRFSIMSYNDSIDLVDGIDKVLERIDNDKNDFVSSSDYQYASPASEEFSDFQITDWETNEEDDEDCEEDLEEMEDEEDPEAFIPKTIATSESNSPLFVRKPLAKSILPRNGKPWTQEEENEITRLHFQGYSFLEIAEHKGRTERSIRMRLEMLEIIEKQDDEEGTMTSFGIDAESTIEDNPFPSGYEIENGKNRCAIVNDKGEKIYSSSGNLKLINGVPYRLCTTYASFSINEVIRTEDDKFLTGKRLVFANSKTPLFQALNKLDYMEAITEIEFDTSTDQEVAIVKVNNLWYGPYGYLSEVTSSSLAPQQHSKVEYVSSRPDKKTMSIEGYEPKGQLKKIDEIADCSYDYYWVMAIIDLMNDPNAPNTLSLDELACMMIAEAWELFQIIPSAIDKEPELKECIEYLLEETKSSDLEPLDWISSKDLVYLTIKDMPMGGVFEDTVEELISTPPVNVLRAWFHDDDESAIIQKSMSFYKSCLYALHPRKRDPYIEMNKSWKRALLKDHDKLMLYFLERYRNYIECQVD